MDNIYQEVLLSRDYIKSVKENISRAFEEQRTELVRRCPVNFEDNYITRYSLFDNRDSPFDNYKE